ncbi:TroA family protein [Brucella intermedia]|uniref:hypothetical protein n=1 Tax=Brucella intermedia TaxID=94625 RepID=UPI002B055E4D|nr:hypothetical protein [Brucella intermedia]
MTIQSCNRQVTFDAPERAVSYDVNMTDTMLALDLQDRMVGYAGISRYYKMEPEVSAKLGNIPELAPHRASKEFLAGAEADFFFAGWNFGMSVGGEVTPETLEPFGIKVYELTGSCSHLGEAAEDDHGGYVYRHPQHRPHLRNRGARRSTRERLSRTA